MEDPYRTEIGKRFLEAGAPVRYGIFEDPSTMEEWSHAAVRAGHWDLLPALHARGADMDLPDPKTGESPRILAFKAHRFDILDQIRDPSNAVGTSRRELDDGDLDVMLVSPSMVYK